LNKCEEIAAAYRAGTVKGAWTVPAMRDAGWKLRGVAVTSLLARLHTIAELLQHLLLWNERIRKTSESCPLRSGKQKKSGRRRRSLERIVATVEPEPRLAGRTDAEFPEADLGKQTRGGLTLTNTC